MHCERCVLNSVIICTQVVVTEQLMAAGRRLLKVAYTVVFYFVSCWDIKI